MGSVFITGGSRGIGAACVRAFAEAGRPAAFTYSARRDKAEALAAETGALALCADSADRDAVENAVKTARESLGAIDTVVCNAGIAQQKLFQDITDDEWLTMLNVNLMGAVRTIRAALPDMLHRQKGSIVIVSSMWASAARPARVITPRARRRSSVCPDRSRSSSGRAASASTASRPVSLPPT